MLQNALEPGYKVCEAVPIWHAHDGPAKFGPQNPSPNFEHRETVVGKFFHGMYVRHKIHVLKQREMFECANEHGVGEGTRKPERIFFGLRCAPLSCLVEAD